MKLIRWFIGKIILFLDAIFSPKPVLRDSSAQALLDERGRLLSLYQYEACPFCVKVRRYMRKQGIHLELRNAKEERVAQELLQGGGKVQVPCLRIPEGQGEVRWLYESNDIIAYLAKWVEVR